MALPRQKKGAERSMKGIGYRRKKRQRTMDDFIEMTDTERAYARSEMDAPPIYYQETGDRL